MHIWPGLKASLKRKSIHLDAAGILPDMACGAVGLWTKGKKFCGNIWCWGRQGGISAQFKKTNTRGSCSLVVNANVFYVVDGTNQSEHLNSSFCSLVYSNQFNSRRTVNSGTWGHKTGTYRNDSPLPYIKPNKWWCYAAVASLEDKRSPEEGGLNGFDPSRLKASKNTSTLWRWLI